MNKFTEITTGTRTVSVRRLRRTDIPARKRYVPTVVTDKNQTNSHLAIIEVSLDLISWVDTKTSKLSNPFSKKVCTERDQGPPIRCAIVRRCDCLYASSTHGTSQLMIRVRNSNSLVFLFANFDSKLFNNTSRYFLNTSFSNPYSPGNLSI